MVGKEGNCLHGNVPDNVPDRRVYPGEFQFSENCGYGGEDLLEIRSLGIPSLLGPHFPGSEGLGRAGARQSRVLDLVGQFPTREEQQGSLGRA